MAIDGLILLDSTNARPIVQSSFRSFPPAYSLLHINAYTNALAMAVRPEDVDPVLLLTLPDSPTACCHIQHRSLIFLCPVSSNRECCVLTLYNGTHVHIHLCLPGHTCRVSRRSNRPSAQGQP